MLRKTNECPQSGMSWLETNVDKVDDIQRIRTETIISHATVEEVGCLSNTDTLFEYSMNR